MIPKPEEPALAVIRDERPEAEGDAGLPSDDRGGLRGYLDVVVDGRWVVAAVAAATVLVALAYGLLVTPTFRTDALVQVEDKKAGNSFLGELSGAFGGASPAESEIEVLRSRALLGAVVRELKLDILVLPRRFPVVGAAVARRHRDPAVAGPFLGREWAWGGERIRVDRLDVAEELVGKWFTLVAGEGGRYTVIGEGGELVVAGEVGAPASGAGVEIFVSELHARAGVQFSLLRALHDDVVGELQRRIRIVEKGKKTGILQLTLHGESPRRIAAILDSLTRAYVRQNVERRSAEAEKTLAFLQTQLPALRANLDAAEAELEGYRSNRGTVDVGLETQAAVARAVEIEKALAELRVEQAAMRERFTEAHPAYAAVAQKAKRLELERGAIDARMRKLPEAELESARRMRDVKVANELYVTVLNKSQELRVVKEGTIGNVRVLDTAMIPARPVAPAKVRILALALLLGVMMGVAGAFVRSAFVDGVEDPDAIERVTGVPVNASVPHSGIQEKNQRRVRGDRAETPLLADQHPKDLAIESLRSLRTSLQFALVEARNQIVSINGPAPLVGKSFVTANLAHLLGEVGKRVLVIDADLRRGQLHHHFGLERGTGLADAIAGKIAAADAIRPTRSANVSAITTGSIPPNPAELLGSERFQRLLADVAARFDLVLVDTPPVLAVTDAALVARHAGVSLLVVRAGVHPMREILTAIRVLRRNGVRVHGIVLNAVRLEKGLGRRNSYHYQYDYQ